MLAVRRNSHILFPLSWAAETGKCVGRHIFINLYAQTGGKV